MTAQLTEAAKKLRETVSIALADRNGWFQVEGEQRFEKDADAALSALNIDWNTAAWIAANAEVVKALALTAVLSAPMTRQRVEAKRAQRAETQSEKDEWDAYRKGNR